VQLTGGFTFHTLLVPPPKYRCLQRLSETAV